MIKQTDKEKQKEKQDYMQSDLFDSKYMTEESLETEKFYDSL